MRTSSEVGDKSTLEEHTDQFARDTQEYLRTFLQLADQKAAFVFTAAGALLTALYSSKALESVVKNGVRLDLCGAIALVSLVTLVATVGFAVAVVFPRESGGGSGLLYWRRIQTYRNSQAYVDAVIGLTHGQVLKERLDNCRHLSDVCERKYGALRWGFWTGVIGTTATLLYFLTCALNK